MALLEVNNLQVKFKVADGVVRAVNNLSFQLDSSEILGIVGESGSGKSQSMLAIMKLLPKNAMVSGSVKFMQQELINLPEKKLNNIRGNKLCIIFQDPMTALNPYLKISTQMTEVLMLHHGLSYHRALKDSVQMLDLVKIPDAQQKIKLYPHQFSGGMRQRVMIAMALLCKPDLLIADEPTTALDVTVQAQILQLLRDLKRDLKMAMIVITHDMGVVANICDRVNVMYAGEIMESGTVEDVFSEPKHPYTQALLRSVPSLDDNTGNFMPIVGDPPNLMHLPVGCPFQERCSQVSDKCSMIDIPVQSFKANWLSKCVLHAK